MAALGPNLTTVLIALGISSIPAYTRLVRGSVLSVKNSEYITSARVIGAKDTRIMLKHVLPNMLGPILVYATLGLGSAIMTTGRSELYRSGCPTPPHPNGGAMLNYGRTYLRTAWWMSIYPGLAVSIIVLAINVFGDGLRDALDPKNTLRFSGNELFTLPQSGQCFCIPTYVGFSRILNKQKQRPLKCCWIKYSKTKQPNVSRWLSLMRVSNRYMFFIKRNSQHFF